MRSAQRTFTSPGPWPFVKVRDGPSREPLRSNGGLALHREGFLTLATATLRRSPAFIYLRSGPRTAPVAAASANEVLRVLDMEISRDKMLAANCTVDLGCCMSCRDQTPCDCARGESLLFCVRELTDICRTSLRKSSMISLYDVELAVWATAHSTSRLPINDSTTRLRVAGLLNICARVGPARFRPAGHQWQPAVPRAIV